MSEHCDRHADFSALMCAAQDGDKAAYSALLREVTPLLRRLVRQKRSFLQLQDIEDLVQDILLSLHAVRATYDPTRPFLPWLTAIAHNRIADGGRRHLRRAAHEIAVEKYPETFDHDATNPVGEGYGDPQALRQAIDKLPQGQRQAIEMLKLRELSLKEAAAASGMSVGALKVSVHRAIKSLRIALTAETDFGHR
jgi:RNA polymerase sigma factor (sigma-70 family)